MFNRHKLKRKYSRKKRVYRKSKDAAFSLKKKDFAWRGKSKNPAHCKQDAFCSTKTKIYLMLLGICFFSVLGIFLYHPFFHISNIDIAGTERLAEGELLDTLYGTLSYRRYGLFPGKSYFFVAVSDLETILGERYPLSAVSITKEFPSTLQVNLEERLSTVIYGNGDTYYLTGLTGRVVEPVRKVTDAEWQIEFQTVSTTDEMGVVLEEQQEVARTHVPDVHGVIQTAGDYPVVINVAVHDEVQANTEVMPEAHIARVIEWYEALTRIQDFAPRYMDVTTPYESTFFTAGPSIRLTIVEDSSAQIERLKTSLSEIDDYRNLSYIDVRFDGKVYWQ